MIIFLGKDRVCAKLTSALVDMRVPSLSRAGRMSALVEIDRIQESFCPLCVVQDP